LRWGTEVENALRNRRKKVTKWESRGEKRATPGKRKAQGEKVKAGGESCLKDQEISRGCPGYGTEKPLDITQ